MSKSYEEVGQNLIRLMSQGTLPWAPDWRSGGTASFRPFNLGRGNHYKGVNYILLLVTMYEQGWSDPRFATLKQFNKLGGSVIKGESGCPVFLWLPMVALPEGFAINGKRHFKADDKRLRRRFGERLEALPSGSWTYVKHKSFTVFNIAQVENLDEAVLEAAGLSGELRPGDGAAQTVASACNEQVGTRFGDYDSPCYLPAFDAVRMPWRHCFASEDAFFAALWHEYAHASKRRLKRQPPAGFDRRLSYAWEEVVAESAAAFVGATLGVEYQPQHAAYLSVWAKRLAEVDKGGTRFLSALTKGQAAADCVLAGLQPGGSCLI